MKTEDKVVYLHKDSKGIVRYVGSGTLKRAYRTDANSGRGTVYDEFVQANGKIEVEIVADGLTKLEAEDLERELYDKYYEDILNHRRPVSVRSISKEMFGEYLYYDETSKSCLRWKVDGHKIKADFEAGCLSKITGYYVVRFQGVLYQVHRIVALLHDLEVNGFVIDHIDRNRSNNKISNLRVVSEKENCKNKSIRSDNSSGVQGVHYDKQKDYWIASWYEDGKKKFKYFPIETYESSEKAFQSAVEYRKQMVELHYLF